MRLGSFWVTRWRMSSDFAAIKAKAASCADIGRCTATWTMQNGALPPLTAARDALYARLLSGSPLEQLVSAPEFAA